MQKKVFLIYLVTLIFIVFILIFFKNKFDSFCVKHKAEAIQLSKDGGDNVWDKKHYIKLLNKLLTEKIDIVYFCDSVMFTNGNSDQTTISEIIQKKTGRRVLTIAGPGFSPLLFQYYIDIIGNINYHPIIIMGVNPRSFSEPWETEYQYKELREFIGFYNWTPSFLNWVSYSIAQKKNTFSYYKEDVFKKIEHQIHGYFKDKHTICTNKTKAEYDITRSYAMPLNTDNPMMSYTSNAIQRSLAFKSRIIVYITPINIDLINETCSKSTVEHIVKNIDTINIFLHTIKNKDIYYLNLSSMLHLENFAEPDYPNEHLTQQGREAVASSLLDAIYQLTRLPPTQK